MACLFAYSEFTQGNWNIKAYYVSRVGSEVVLILVGTKGIDKTVKTIKLGTVEEILKDNSGFAKLLNERIFNISKQESPIWKSFDNVKGKDRKCSGFGRDKQYYEWDYTHNDIEVYDHKGKHIGSMDPITGDIYKGPVEGRRIQID